MILRQVGGDYREAWRQLSASVGVSAAPEPGPFRIRIQTEADLEADRFEMLAWEDPRKADGPGSPFWRQDEMPEGVLEPGAEPLVGRGAGKTARGIAEDIWGKEDVTAVWYSDSWMRAQVRRWIPKARALAAGGWRDLVPRHVPELWRDAPTAGPDACRQIALRHPPSGAAVAGARRRLHRQRSRNPGGCGGHAGPEV